MLRIRLRHHEDTLPLRLSGAFLVPLNRSRCGHHGACLLAARIQPGAMAVDRYNLSSIILSAQQKGVPGCRNGLKWARQATSSSAFSEWFGKEIHPGTDISVSVNSSYRVCSETGCLAAWWGTLVACFRCLDTIV
jgi:hypothetical protein